MDPDDYMTWPEQRGEVSQPSRADVQPGNFIDVNLLATARLRRIAEIMSHLPEPERTELAALIFDQVDEITRMTLHAYDAAHQRREPGAH